VVPAHDDLGIDRVLFKVRVIESFRGTQKAGDIVSVRTGFGGGDCGYRFESGTKYLIDAAKKEDMFFTGICFLTAPVGEAEVDLRNLRRIAGGQRVPDLTGVLMRGTETDDGYSVTPLKGVPVKAKRITGGIAQKAVTDDQGSFTVARVPKGKYSLTLGLPTNLSAAYTDFGIFSEDQVPSISIESTDADSAACHIRIDVEPSGSISGVVQSRGGGPIEGWVNADTVSNFKLQILNFKSPDCVFFAAQERKQQIKEHLSDARNARPFSATFLFVQERFLGAHWRCESTLYRVNTVP